MIGLVTTPYGVIILICCMVLFFVLWYRSIGHNNKSYAELRAMLDEEVHERACNCRVPPAWIFEDYPEFKLYYERLDYAERTGTTADIPLFKKRKGFT